MFFHLLFCFLLFFCKYINPDQKFTALWEFARTVCGFFLTRSAAEAEWLDGQIDAGGLRDVELVLQTADTPIIL